MILDKEQISEILRIIDFQHMLFAADSVGVEVLDENDINLLHSFGVNVKEIVGGIPNSEQAYQFGKLSAAIGRYNILRGADSYNEFKRFISKGGFAELTAVERGALNHIKEQSYSSIKDLSAKVKSDVKAVISRRQYESIIREASKEGVQKRESLSDIMRKIGEKTGDWDRKLGRIVDTEMHNAFEYGRAEYYRSETGGETLVYKDVYPGACRHCIRLYLTKGIGSEPKLFKLSVLIMNGDNIGVKPVDWKPVIGAVHPYCRCTLNKVPHGYKWSTESKSFSVPDHEFNRKTDAHIRAPITVTIGAESYVV